MYLWNRFSIEPALPASSANSKRVLDANIITNQPTFLQTRLPIPPGIPAFKPRSAFEFPSSKPFIFGRVYHMAWTSHPLSIYSTTSLSTILMLLQSFFWRASVPNQVLPVATSMSSSFFRSPGVTFLKARRHCLKFSTKDV